MPAIRRVVNRVASSPLLLSKKSCNQKPTATVRTRPPHVLACTSPAQTLITTFPPSTPSSTAPTSTVLNTLASGSHALLQPAINLKNAHHPDLFSPSSTIVGNADQTNHASPTSTAVNEGTFSPPHATQSKLDRSNLAEVVFQKSMQIALPQMTMQSVVMGPKSPEVTLMGAYRILKDGHDIIAIVVEGTALCELLDLVVSLRYPTWNIMPHPSTKTKMPAGDASTEGPSKTPTTCPVDLPTVSGSQPQIARPDQTVPTIPPATTMTIDSHPGPHSLDGGNGVAGEITLPPALTAIAESHVTNIGSNSTNVADVHPARDHAQRTPNSTEGVATSAAATPVSDSNITAGMLDGQVLSTHTQSAETGEVLVSPQDHVVMTCGEVPTAFASQLSYAAPDSPSTVALDDSVFDDDDDMTLSREDDGVAYMLSEILAALTLDENEEGVDMHMDAEDPMASLTVMTSHETVGSATIAEENITLMAAEQVQYPPATAIWGGITAMEEVQSEELPAGWIIEDAEITNAVNGPATVEGVVTMEEIEDAEAPGIIMEDATEAGPPFVGTMDGAQVTPTLMDLSENSSDLSTAALAASPMDVTDQVPAAAPIQATATASTSIAGSTSSVLISEVYPAPMIVMSAEPAFHIHVPPAPLDVLVNTDAAMSVTTSTSQMTTEDTISGDSLNDGSASTSGLLSTTQAASLAIPARHIESAVEASTGDSPSASQTLTPSEDAPTGGVQDAEGSVQTAKSEHDETTEETTVQGETPTADTANNETAPLSEQQVSSHLVVSLDERVLPTSTVVPTTGIYGQEGPASTPSPVQTPRDDEVMHKERSTTSHIPQHSTAVVLPVGQAPERIIVRTRVEHTNLGQRDRFRPHTQYTVRGSAAPRRFAVIEPSDDDTSSMEEDSEDTPARIQSGSDTAVLANSEAGPSAAVAPTAIKGNNHRRRALVDSPKAIVGGKRSREDTADGDNEENTRASKRQFKMKSTDDGAVRQGVETSSAGSLSIQPVAAASATVTPAGTATSSTAASGISPLSGTLAPPPTTLGDQGGVVPAPTAAVNSQILVTAPSAPSVTIGKRRRDDASEEDEKTNEADGAASAAVQDRAVKFV
ncbi:hypothetical protein FRB96_003983 [Tulasnella sp. 330]|nr:hypothetical protein FRB96_003983 [Tulasnella sp. 330]